MRSFKSTGTFQGGKSRHRLFLNEDLHINTEHAGFENLNRKKHKCTSFNH
jgi:hypothetical protein